MWRKRPQRMTVDENEEVRESAMATVMGTVMMNPLAMIMSMEAISSA